VVRQFEGNRDRGGQNRLVVRADFDSSKYFGLKALHGMDFVRAIDEQASEVIVVLSGR
jgi:hypothetical protein